MYMVTKLRKASRHRKHRNHVERRRKLELAIYLASHNHVEAIQPDTLSSHHNEELTTEEHKPSEVSPDKCLTDVVEIDTSHVQFVKAQLPSEDETVDKMPEALPVSGQATPACSDKDLSDVEIGEFVFVPSPVLDEPTNLYTSGSSNSYEMITTERLVEESVEAAAPMRRSRFRWLCVACK